MRDFRYRAAIAALVGLAMLMLARPLPLRADATPAIGDSPLRLFTHTLPNGLQVVVVENPAVPLVTIEVAVHNGAMNEPLELNGLSHLYEHMFFKGNAVIPNQEAYMRTLRKLGAIWNGTTGNERVNYFFTMPSRHLAEGLSFMAHAITSPRFDPEELKKERQVVLGEFDRNEAEPGYHLAHAMDQLMWYQYPTYKEPLGNRASIEVASVEQMRWMQHVYYIPNNSALFVVGDVHHDEVFRLVASQYGAWKAGPNPFVAHPLVQHPPLPASRAVVVQQPVHNVSIRLSWQGPSTARDLKGAQVADVSSYAVCQEDSRLKKALVGSGLANDVNLGYATLSNTGEIEMTIETTPETALQAVAVALQEVSHFADSDYLSEAQWRNAQTLLAVGDLYDREHVTDFSHSLSFWWAVANVQAYLDYIPAVRGATRADASAYASRYIVGKPLVLGVMVSPEAATHEGITEAALQQLLQPQPTPKKPPQSMIVYAASLQERPAVIAQAAPPAPVAETLPNVESFTVDGLQVLLRRNPASPVVAASLYFRGGCTNLTPETQGIEDLALLTANRGSARGLSREARAHRYDAMGSVVNESCQPDLSRLDLKCIPDFFDASWTLFTDGVLAPSFDASDIELYRRRQLAALKAERDRPDLEVTRLGMEAFFVGHPYALRQNGVEDVVTHLTPQQVADYWKGLAVKSRMLLVVVGNLPRPRLEAAIRATLSQLPQGNWTPVTLPAVAPRPTAVIPEARTLPTTYVRGLFPAPNPQDAEYPAASVALQILNNRLFEEVRTKRNLSYAVYAGLSGRLSNYGLLYVTSTRPNDAVSVIMQEVKRIGSEPLPRERLQEEIAGFSTRYYLSMETSEAQAQQFGWSQITAGDWRRAATLVRDVQQVTPEQVEAAAHRWIHDVQWAVLGDTEHLTPDVFH